MNHFVIFYTNPFSIIMTKGAPGNLKILKCFEYDSNVITDLDFIFDIFGFYFDFALFFENEGLAILFLQNSIKFELSFYREIAIEKLNSIAIMDRDPLTSLQNRSALLRTKREGKLILTDLNNFKSINDVKGHKEGDKALLLFCSLLKRFFDEKFIFRYGGDEFVILTSLPEKRIKEIFCSINARLSTFYDGLSSSYGISLNAINLLYSLEEADEMLYLQKRDIR